MKCLAHTQRQRVWSVFDITLLDQRSGFVSFLVEGNGAKRLFENESGGHRFQRVPPNEKRGRVHTSTITVATIDSSVEKTNIKESDIEFDTKRGTGPGGQNKNKTESCVVAKHKQTGITVKIDARSQHQNRILAVKILEQRINELNESKNKSAIDQSRKAQVGSGMRGDKVRTYRQQDDSVKDHRTGKTWRLKSWMKGEW